MEADWRRHIKSTLRCTLQCTPIGNEWLDNNGIHPLASFCLSWNNWKIHLFLFTEFHSANTNRNWLHYCTYTFNFPTIIINNYQIEQKFDFKWKAMFQIDDGHQNRTRTREIPKLNWHCWLFVEFSVKSINYLQELNIANSIRRQCR